MARSRMRTGTGWAVAALAGALTISSCTSTVEATVIPGTPAPVATVASPEASPEPVGEPTASAGPATSAPAPEPTAVPEPAEPVPSAAPIAPIAPIEPGAALLAAQALPVKGRAPKTGYDRDLFGSGWVDVDRNGCDTRNDILARDLTALETKPGTGGCVVLRGRLVDPYGGESIAFVRGNATSTAVQIDHVVALSDAWQKGAQGWDAGVRVAFANDPLNLLAVDGPLNASKGDGDTATWLPPRKEIRCAYVARQVAVKAKYGAWVTQAERDAMVRVLSACPGEALPVGADDPIVAVTVRAEPEPAKEEAKPAPKPKPKPKPESKPEPADDVYYKNCTAARDAGAAPVYRGDPGYASHLDRDDDGVGCE